MPFQKGNTHGKGRPKGAPNKLSAVAKDVIASAAESLGGHKRLVAWAKEDKQNERIFWGSIYPRLLPHEVSGPDGEAIGVHTIVNNYATPAPAADRAPAR